NEIERIASHQGQRRLGRGLQNTHVLGTGDLNTLDDILICSVEHHQFHGVTWRDILQPTEESVPMARDPSVSSLAQPCRANDPPDTPVQCQVIRSVINGYFQLQFRNAENRGWSPVFGRQTLHICFDSLVTPKTEVEGLAGA